MPDSNNCNCQEQSQGKEKSPGNILSSKQKGKGKIWSEEEMAKAKPYPIEVSEEILKKNKQESKE